MRKNHKASQKAAAQKAEDRRQHTRFPVCEGMIEPITVKFEAMKSKGAQPAILTNLSAGGMSLLMFLEPPTAKRLDMVLTLPGLAEVPVEGKVVRVNQKGDTYNIGIAFTRIQKKHQSKISGMAQDHIDCEMRIGLKLPEVCVSSCSFNAMCGKTQKAPFWTGKK
jgi:hypothetical protein